MGSLLTQPALGILQEVQGRQGRFPAGSDRGSAGSGVKGELYLKGVVLFHHFLPEDDPLRSVLGRDMSGLGETRSIRISLWASHAQGRGK